MKLNILQHVPFEGPAMIQDWASTHGHQIEIYKTYLGELPSDSSFDLLVVMGGPMSANDTFDWLEKEKEFILESIQEEKLILGICLGAQLIAKVLGSKIYKNPDKEIGWFPITCAENFLSPTLNVLHWHGETFDLPEGAELLAKSEACQNQAFAYKDNVLGLLFHLEMNENTIREIVYHCKDELISGKFIQTEEEILSKDNNIAECKTELFDLLDGFALRFQEI